jgi:hypothetical protein
MLEHQNFLWGDFSAVFFPDIPDNPDYWLNGKIGKVGDVYGAAL